MSQQFDRQDRRIPQISNSVIPTLATMNNNIINDVSSNRMEKFCMPTSSSNLPSASTLSLTSRINTSSNHLEEPFGLIKSTTISLQYNSSTVIQNSNNASTPFSTVGTNSNSVVNPEAFNVSPASILTLDRDNVRSISQFSPSTISFANELTPSNSSQFASNNDAMCNQEIIIKNATNVNGNLSLPLISSGNSTFPTMRCWKRRRSGNQSLEDSNKLDAEQSAELYHVQSDSRIQQSLSLSRLQQTSFPIESHESEMSNIMLSDATCLNGYTPIEREFPYDTETNLCYMVQLPPTTYSSIATINSEEEEEEKVFKELVPVKSYSITDPFTEMINTTTHASSIGFQESQSSRQLVLDSVIPMNEDDSTSKRYQASLVTSQLTPSLLKKKIHPKNDGNPSMNTNHEGNNNLCVVCNDKSSGKHYSVPSCEGCKSFFRRANEEKTKYKCQNQGNCIVNRESRKKCPSCRLKKCLSVGMNPELVRSDCNRRRKREKRMDDGGNKKVEDDYY